MYFIQEVNEYEIWSFHYHNVADFSPMVDNHGITNCTCWLKCQHSTLYDGGSKLVFNLGMFKHLVWFSLLFLNMTY